MRIPPSLIIMSLVTATPFGLAIRDTLSNKQPRLFEDDGLGMMLGEHHESRHDREMYEQYEAEMAKEAAQKAQKRIEATDRLSMLFGSKPATLGALFDGIKLGADSSSFQPEDARQRIEQESERGFISVSFDADTRVLRSIDVSISSNDYDTSGDAEMCRSLHDKLVAAWGPATNGRWIDETRHQRAHLTEGAMCTLTFDRTVTPDEWFAQVPLQLVGKPERALDVYGENNAISFEERDDDIGRWYLPAMGIAEGNTEITAMIDKHHIVGIRISGVGDFDSILAVRDALSKQLKAKPKHDEEADTYTWKGKPAARLTVVDGDDHFDLLLGKDPWE